MRTEPDVINRHIGARLRSIRKTRDMSQSDLGAVLGVWFQQMGNYEKGKDRLSAGALYVLSRVLKVNSKAFFEGLAYPGAGLAEDGAVYKTEIENLPHTDRLDAAFKQTRSQSDRALAVEIVETIARRGNELA